MKVVQLDASVRGLFTAINANIKEDVVLILVKMEVNAQKILQTLPDIFVLVHRVYLFNNIKNLSSSLRILRLWWHEL
jgi:hypothetical protein